MIALFKISSSQLTKTKCNDFSPIFRALPSFSLFTEKKIYCYQLGIDLLLHYPSKNKPTPILLQYSGLNTGFQEIMLIILKNSSKIALKLLSLISLVLKAQLTQERDYLLTSQIALDLVIKIYVLE